MGHRLEMTGVFFMPAARIRPGFFHAVFEGRWSWWRTGSRALRWRVAAILPSELSDRAWGWGFAAVVSESVNGRPWRVFILGDMY